MFPLLSAVFSILFVREDLYLDPGSGSFLIQLIIASLLGAAFIFRSSWSKIKGFFDRSTNKSDDDIETKEENEV